MLRFVRRFLWQHSVNSVHPSSSSLAQDGAHSWLWWSRDTATFCNHVMWLSFAFLSPFHHSSSFSSFYYFDSDFWYIDTHPTLAGLYPFLLGSPARCAFLLYLCLYICLGSPARSRLSRSAVALTNGNISNYFEICRAWTNGIIGIYYAVFSWKNVVSGLKLIFKVSLYH